MRTPRTIVFAALFASAIAAPAHAQTAADTAAARDLFVEASKLAQAEHLAEARDLYQRSLKLKRAGITLYSLGVIEKKMGLFVEATEHFRAFLSEPNDARTKPYETPAHDAITEIAPKIAKLKVNVVPVDAPAVVLKVDGETVPEAARVIAREVNPGAHHVEVSATGFNAETKDVDVTAGGLETLVITLTKAAPTANPLGVPAGSSTAVGPVAPTASSGSNGGPPPANNHNLALGLTIGGGAVFATGVVVGLLGVSQASSSKTKDGSDAKSAKSKALVGDILGVAGLATAGIGGYLLFFPSKDGAASGVGVSILPGFASASLRRSF